MHGVWSPWFIAVRGFPFVLNDGPEKSMDLVFAFSCVAITRCIALGISQSVVEQQVENGLRHIVLWIVPVGPVEGDLKLIQLACTKLIIRSHVTEILLHLVLRVVIVKRKRIYRDSADDMHSPPLPMTLLFQQHHLAQTPHRFRTRPPRRSSSPPINVTWVHHRVKMTNTRQAPMMKHPLNQLTTPRWTSLPVSKISYRSSMRWNALAVIFFPNLIPEASWIFPIRILQDPKSLGPCLVLCKILQISCVILLLGTRQGMNRFGQDPICFLNISWH